MKPDIAPKSEVVFILWSIGTACDANWPEDSFLVSAIVVCSFTIYFQSLHSTCRPRFIYFPWGVNPKMKNFAKYCVTCYNKVILIY